MSELTCMPGPERVLTAPGEDYLKLQLALDKLQRVSWIQGLAQWQVMATFTFRQKTGSNGRTYGMGIYGAQARFEQTMASRLPGVSYVEAIEKNPGCDGYHVHSLWADCANVYRKEEWAHWFKKYGIALIEPVRSPGDVSGYASKYLTKEDAWFNVKLQWHRMEAIRNAAFVLRLEKPLEVSVAHMSCPL